MSTSETRTEVSTGRPDRRPVPVGTPRRASIVLRLAWLHLRYLRFDTTMLASLPEGRHRPAGRLARGELVLAGVWNSRMSTLLQRLNAPYARCMKRALVMAMLLPDEPHLELVMGVRPDEPSVGHAWLEADGEVLLEGFAAHDSPYVTIRRLRVAPYRRNA